MKKFQNYLSNPYFCTNHGIKVNRAHLTRFIFDWN